MSWATDEHSIDEPSLLSLKVKAQRESREGTPLTITEGTCFLVQDRGHDFLITNRHVLTNRQPDDPERQVAGSSSLPSFLRVEFTGETLNTWRSHRVELYSETDGRAVWLQHPSGTHVDVAIIPIPRIPGTTYRHYELEPVTPMTRNVAMDVSVIGFPFEIPVDGHLPIWARGTVATEPALNYRGDRAFLIDSRTRSGQSGSPVILWAPPMSVVPIQGHGAVVRSQASFELLGIYSGRITKDSDLGRVWKREVIREILDAGQRDPQVFE
jgi:hypothetical protein